MKFKQPYFISPHAVGRFQERICDISPAEVVETVQTALQDPGLPVDAEIRDGELSLIYRAKFHGREYYIATTPPKAEGEWPQVPTILYNHAKFLRTKKRRPRFATDREKQLIPLLRRRFTIKECMKITGRSHSTIERHSPKARPFRRWTEAEKAKALNMRTQGRTYGQIAEKLGRSRKSVEIFFCRLRKEAREDPDRLIALKVLAFCMNPARVLRAVKDAGLVEEVKRRVLRGEIDL